MSDMLDYLVLNTRGTDVTYVPQGWGEDVLSCLYWKDCGNVRLVVTPSNLFPDRWTWIARSLTGSAVTSACEDYDSRIKAQAAAEAWYSELTSTVTVSAAGAAAMLGVGRYRKLPVVIDAVLVRRGISVLALMDWTEGKVRSTALEGQVEIDTLEGKLSMNVDAAPFWIIRDVKGEYYPCAEDVFSQTYERVD